MNPAPGHPATGTVRVMVVDDHDMVREALTGLLNNLVGVSVCGEADSVEQGMERAVELRPDIMLVDMMMRGRDGLELVRHVRASLPGTSVLVVSMNEEQSCAEDARSSGAHGYIMKDRLTDDLHPAIEAIRGGKPWYPLRARQANDERFGTDPSRTHAN